MQLNIPDTLYEKILADAKENNVSAKAMVIHVLSKNYKSKG